jgi:DNA-binding PucR family transcriptional regulator
VRVEEARSTAFAAGGTVAAVPRVTGKLDSAELDSAIALLGRDREVAIAFVESELGSVEALGARSERLLETLEVFLKHGQRVANASAISGRHRDTVHRHLREIEELLGCKIEERSADLLWALRLRRAFGVAASPRALL